MPKTQIKDIGYKLFIALLLTGTFGFITYGTHKMNGSVFCDVIAITLYLLSLIHVFLIDNE